ncbi:MAG: MFS transporter, partial [Sphaerochaetaceae bacterium]|nr:MFS transporter [Sphaerochaetaceae bacterium]
MEKQKNKIHYAWVILAVCCCYYAALSGLVVHCRGIYYRPASEDLGITPALYASYTMFGGIVGVITMGPVVKLFGKYNIKVMMIIYSAIFCFGYASLGVAQNMTHCYISGMIFSIVSSFVFSYPTSYLIRNWFTKKRGLAMGLASGCSSILGAIMSILVERLIEGVGWRNSYFITCIIAFLWVAIPTILFVVRRPEDMGLEPYGGPALEEPKKVEKAKLNKDIVLKALPVGLISFAFTMAAVNNLHLSSYAIDLNKTAIFGAKLASACMIGNMVSNLASGVLIDKIGVYKASIITVVTLVLSYFALIMKINSSWILLLTAFFLGQATSCVGIHV